MGTSVKTVMTRDVICGSRESNTDSLGQFDTEIGPLGSVSEKQERKTGPVGCFPLLLFFARAILPSYKLYVCVGIFEHLVFHQVSLFLSLKHTRSGREGRHRDDVAGCKRAELVGWDERLIQMAGRGLLLPLRCILTRLCCCAGSPSILHFFSRWRCCDFNIFLMYLVVMDLSSLSLSLDRGGKLLVAC